MSWKLGKGCFVRTRVQWAILAIASCQLCAFGAPPAPADLLVSGIENPLAVERESIQFGWRLQGTRRGAAQTAYQILVSSSRERLQEGAGDWWDSGKVASDKTASVAYLGKALPPGARCWWKVRIWDESGHPSRYSMPARFDTGLEKGEWTARYLWDGTTNFNNFAYFRKTFSLPRRPALAKVYVSAHNDYLLYLNGRVLGRGPARSNPGCYGQYNAYDVTDLLKRGSNVLAAVGHWQGNWRDSGVNAEPAFLLEAQVKFDDGSTLIVATDESWKTLASTGFVETNAVYFGGAGGARNRAAIQFDARLEPEGWTTLAYDDSKWGPASVVDRSSFTLFPQRVALQQEQAELKPVNIQQRGADWLVDFGRCLNGWPKLTLRANRPGDQVRISYFQLGAYPCSSRRKEALISDRPAIKGDQSLLTSAATGGERGASGWDEYTCRGGVETWKPDLGRHASFQMLKISGYSGPLRAADVRAVWACTGAEVAGKFRCSSSLLNDIYEMCERSARQNVQQGIISVDANREQSPWLADSWNIGNVLLYNHRHTLMIDKVLRDYAGEQLPCGDFYACSPAAIFHSAEWSMYWPMLLWEQYLFSGDEELLRRMAPRLSAFLNWLKQYQDAETKLINPPNGNLSQGQRISDYAGGNLPNGGFNAATACQYYENLRIASKVFAVLDQRQQAEQYQQQAEEVRGGINAHLFNGQYYLARTNRKGMFPLASAWALRFDLVPPAAKARVLASIREHGTPILGGYGGDAFYSGLLHAGGMGDFVVRDLERYRLMLKGNGANWESFNGGGEYNHAWTAYPGYLFQKYISGIQPTGGGFSTFDVRPEIAGLSFAESAVPTIKGLITTRWEKLAGHRLGLSLTVPPGAEATLFIPGPAGDIATVEESGVILWPIRPGARVPGVVAVAEENGSIRCRLRAGAYHFKIRFGVEP
jgi:alpha-L-rhamnosidase